MIEVDVISDLIKHRASVFQSIDQYGRVGFDVKAIFDLATESLHKLVIQPSFVHCSVPGKKEWYETPYAYNGEFATPFNVFSVVEHVGDKDDTKMVFLFMRAGKSVVDSAEDLDFSHIVEREIDTLYVVGFVRTKKGWNIQPPYSAGVDKLGETHVSYICVRKGAHSYDVIKNILKTYKVFDISKDGTYEYANSTDEVRTSDIERHVTTLLNEVVFPISWINTKTDKIFKPRSEKILTPTQVAAAKKPLWEYHMVDVSAVRELPSPCLGGTHASPRWHLRRGHWRTLRSGKKVFIHQMEVGDKKSGVIEKDYTIGT